MLSSHSLNLSGAPTVADRPLLMQESVCGQGRYRNDVHDRTRGQEKNLFPDSPALLLTNGVNFVKNDTKVRRKRRASGSQIGVPTI